MSKQHVHVNARRVVSCTDGYNDNSTCIYSIFTNKLRIEIIASKSDYYPRVRGLDSRHLDNFKSELGVERVLPNLTRANG